MVSIVTSNAIVAECQVLNLTPPSKIGTGICFLDHMVDQLDIDAFSSVQRDGCTVYRSSFYKAVGI